MGLRLNLALRFISSTVFLALFTSTAAAKTESPAELYRRFIELAEEAQSTGSTQAIEIFVRSHATSISEIAKQSHYPLLLFFAGVKSSNCR